MQRAGYGFKMKNPKVVVDMSTHLLRQGLTTRQVQTRLSQLYHVDISLPTISTWAKRDGVAFEGTKRLKACSFCGSRTRHKESCPVAKNLGPRENPFDARAAFLV